MAGFESMDKALGRYYESLGRNDYFNSDGIGKFLDFCYREDFQEDEIDDELAEMEECSYLEFDDNFPFKSSLKDEYEKQMYILNILKKCYNDPNAFRTKQKSNDDDDSESNKTSSKQQSKATKNDDIEVFNIWTK